MRFDVKKFLVEYGFPAWVVRKVEEFQKKSEEKVLDATHAVTEMMAQMERGP